jgi:hypothetical protein
VIVGNPLRRQQPDPPREVVIDSRSHGARPVVRFGVYELTVNRNGDLHRHWDDCRSTYFSLLSARFPRLRLKVPQLLGYFLPFS